MKTKLNKKIFHALMAMLVIVMIVTVSCKKDDDSTPTPNVELTVTSMSPDSGGEGTEVNINGTGFSTIAANNTVTLADKPCQVLVSTATLIKVKIPADAATGKIKVTVGGKTVETPVFTFIPPGPELLIESIVPATGPKGTEVEITGTAFSAVKENNVVKINGKTATVLSASSTKIKVVIPANAGTGVIQVTVGGETVESAEFEYVYTTEVHTFAGSSSGYLEGTGMEAKFAGPYKVAVDAEGNVYVVDTSNHRIRKITPDGVTSTLAGNGESGDADGTGEEAQFHYPYGITMGPDGNIYVADTHNHRIRMVTPEGVVTTVAGSTGGYLDGTGTEAQFYYLTGITFDTDGNLFIADKDNNKIRKMTPDGVVTTFAGSTSGYVDATGTEAKFAGPFNISFDANGDFYVADASNHRIRKVTSEGVVTTVAGSTQGYAEGIGDAAQFNYPYDVAVDANGDILVADTFNHSVRKISVADGSTSRIAGTGTNGSNDGLASTATFSWLTGVTIAPNGTIYIADKDSHRIRTITTD